MAAPAVVAAAKTAAAILTDEKARTAALSIIVGVIAAILLPILMLIAMITMPFAELGSMFGGDDYDQIVEFRNEYGFDQYIDPNDEDYLSSAGLVIEGVTFTDGATDVVYYNQLDSRWKDEPYGLTGTIGSSACGPTSLSIVVSSLTDRTIDPVQMSRWSYENGYRCEGKVNTIIAFEVWGIDVKDLEKRMKKIKELSL